MHLISHALHPLNHILVSMSTSWSIYGRTSHGVQRSSSPIEAAIAEGEQNSIMKINHAKEQNSEHTSEGELYTGDESGENQPSNTTK